MTIEDVLERMRAIDAELRPRDGVAWFNRLYLRVTENVHAAVTGGELRRVAFLERLDVVFAELYLAAYADSSRARAAVPRAWAPLFEARRRRTIAPIQFALAGMNAHINHDLPIALAATAAELSVDLRRPSPEWDDFRLVNAILERTQDEVKREFTRGFVGDLDRAFGRLDDVVAIWSVARARDHAWIVAETLEELAGAPELRESYLTALARMVGFAGRGLLVPTATVRSA